MMRAFLCLALVGCSGGSSSSSDAGGVDGASAATQATGMVRGETVRVTSAYAIHHDNFGFGIPGIELYVSTGADTCTARFPATKNATNFVIDVIGNPLAPGDYTIIDAGPGAAVTAPKNGEADVVYNTTDAFCAEGTEDVATGGTLVLTRSDQAGVAGTFDITFTDGHVTGTFDAPLCDATSTPTYSVNCN
jgi:hypothetical protein